MMLKPIRFPIEKIKYAATLFGKTKSMQLPDKLTKRSVTSLSEMAQEVIANREMISLGTGLVSVASGAFGYGLNLFLARKTMTSKRLIFIVKQAPANELPADFLSLLKITDINSKDSDGNTALHYACLRGHTNIVCALLSMGAMTDIKNKQGDTAFFLAVAAGHRPVIDIFCDVATQYTTGVFFTKKVSISEIVNQPTKKNERAILEAAFNNHQDVFTKLITLGADIRVKNQKGETVLFWAVMHNDISRVEHILYNANITNEEVMHLIEHEDYNQSRTPLYIAAHKGYTEIVKLLLRRGAKNTLSSIHKETPLQAAIRNGHEDVTLLLSKDSEAYRMVTPDGLSAIDYVISRILRRQDILDSELFIIEKYMFESTITITDKVKLSRIAAYSHEIDLSFKEIDLENDVFLQNSSLWVHLCAIANKSELILSKSFLIKQNTLNQYGYTAIFDAILYQSISAVSALIAIGEDINFLRKDGSSPLIMAAIFQQTEIALLLIDKNADIHQANIYGETALYYAIINNDLTLAKKLCENNIDTRHIDKQGYSYMHVVAKFGSAEMARLLLHYNALRDPKTKNHEYLPTHLAVICKNIEVLNVLVLEKHADPTAQNINNLTLTQLARGDKTILSIIEDSPYYKASMEENESVSNTRFF